MADQTHGPWWESFNDPVLNDLEIRLGTANQDLKAAIARYDQALANARYARSDFYPNITGFGSYSRAQTSKNTARVSPTTLFSDAQFGAQLSYELDLWGRVRNQVKSAESRAQASAADLAAVQLALQSELAMNYFSLRGQDLILEILKQTVDAYQKALDLTQNRYKGGAATAADVDQAQTQLENTKTLLADTQLKRSQLEHAIAVLIGEVPANFALAALSPEKEQNIQLAPINPDLASTLLQRRPDVAAQGRLVAAANADIGVARAAFFPTFSLGSAVGYEGAKANNLLNADSLLWSLGPSFAVTLLDGGALAALSAQARAVYTETAANYRKTVLTAYQDVEDSLVAINQLDKETETQTAATKAAERALQQYQNRYKGGIATYLDVVVQQNTALQAELNFVNLQTRRVNAQVQLIKALGGGWQTPMETAKQ